MPNDYTEAVLRARNRQLRALSKESRRRLAEEYLQALRQVTQNPNQFGNTDEFIDALRRALVTYARRANLQVNEIQELAAQAAGEAHEEALEKVGVGTSLTNVSQEAVNAMYKRRSLGAVQTFKTLNRFSAEATAEELGRVLQQLTIQGRSPNAAYRAVAEALVSGNPELEWLMDNYGTRGGVRLSSDVSPNPEAQAIASTIGHNAKRIALTEVQQSYWEADRISAAKSPVVRALRWTLSGAHPEPDICDAYAELDVHGLGPGLYFPETLPIKPHPYCICSVGYEMLESGEERPDPTQPRQVTPEQVAAVMPNATQHAINTTAGKLNAQAQKAHEIWQEKL